jgi:seryl-tRNA synthetase
VGQSDEDVIRAASRAAASLKAARTLIVALERQRVALEQRINANEATITTLRKEVVNEKASVAEMTRKLQAAEARESKLKAELGNTQTKLTAAEARITAFQAEVDRLTMELQNAKQQPVPVAVQPKVVAPSRVWYVVAVAAGAALGVIVGLAAN